MTEIGESILCLLVPAPVLNVTDLTERSFKKLSTSPQVFPNKRQELRRDLSVDGKCLPNIDRTDCYGEEICAG